MVQGYLPVQDPGLCTKTIPSLFTLVQDPNPGTRFFFFFFFYFYFSLLFRVGIRRGLYFLYKVLILVQELLTRGES
jgi:hypothetical protein